MFNLFTKLLNEIMTKTNFNRNELNKKSETLLAHLHNSAVIADNFLLLVLVSLC